MYFVAAICTVDNDDILAGGGKSGERATDDFVADSSELQNVACHCHSVGWLVDESFVRAVGRSVGCR